MAKSLWTLVFIVFTLQPKEKKLYQKLDCNVNTVTKLEIICKGQTIKSPITDSAAINQFILLLKDASYFKDAQKFKSTLSYKLTNDSVWLVSLEFGEEYLKYRGKYYKNKELVTFTKKWFDIDMIKNEDYYLCGKYK